MVVDALFGVDRAGGCVVAVVLDVVCGGVFLRCLMVLLDCGVWWWCFVMMLMVVCTVCTDGA